MKDVSCFAVANKEIASRALACRDTSIQANTFERTRRNISNELGLLATKFYPGFRCSAARAVEQPMIME